MLICVALQHHGCLKLSQSSEHDRCISFATVCSDRRRVACQNVLFRR